MVASPDGSILGQGPEKDQRGRYPRPVMEIRSTSRVVAAVAPTIALMIGALACGGKERSPEEQIRARLAEIEQLAEAGDVAGVKELISERYEDAAGNDRRALAAWLTFQRMQHRNLYVWSRIRTLELVAPEQASVVVVAGMAASPISGPADLARMRADVYEIDLDLVDEGGSDWRVVSASWRPTRPTDLL
jgi:hypothetical protein